MNSSGLNHFPSNKMFDDAGDAWGKPNFLNRHIEARSPVGRNSAFYSMNHKNRGVAIILNHEFFEIKTLKDRSGTKVDCEKLSSTLQGLGFNVFPYHNLRLKDITKVIEEAARTDHSENDCFLLAVLSHGEMGILYSNDAPYKPESLWAFFTADKCPSLAGKPKIFIIQACQGDKLDPGIKMRTEVDSKDSLGYKIPIHSDFLIAYSTVPGEKHCFICILVLGFFSWRNTTNGSWFIQALCAELKANGAHLDMLTLLTFVCQRVALDFESNTPGDVKMHQQKQIPCITTMLTRLIKFTPK
uniref:Caspase-1 n=1 Tax=Timema douglasi TaxID=61478 RepID=A0A7R8VLT7_TIMDO|nr:unnamed protein product [Timema douglasi]